MLRPESSLFGNASKEMFDSYERVRKGKVFLQKHVCRVGDWEVSPLYNHGVARFWKEVYHIH
jgi:hypothetical protein